MEVIEAVFSIEPVKNGESELMVAPFQNSTRNSAGWSDRSDVVQCYRPEKLRLLNLASSWRR
jgi:hypothetical protein